jgi:hypothetical protein
VGDVVVGSVDVNWDSSETHVDITSLGGVVVEVGFGHGVHDCGGVLSFVVNEVGDVVGTVDVGRD